VFSDSFPPNRRLLPVWGAMTGWQSGALGLIFHPAVGPLPRSLFVRSGCAPSVTRCR